jgi:hypothetical protein
MKRKSLIRIISSPFIRTNKKTKTKLNDPYLSIYGQLIEDTHDVLKMVLVWQIIHVRIKVNFIAHCLAKVAIKQVMDQV